MQAKLKYFRLLGIEPTTDKQLIKKAYRKKAMALHPDKNPSKQAQTDFIKLTEAYENLIGLQQQPTSKDYVKTAEEIRAEKLKSARQQYRKMQASEKEKDAAYFKQITSGKMWKLFKIAAYYCLFFSLVLAADYFLTRDHKAIEKAEFYTFLPSMVKVDDELFEIDNKEFWKNKSKPMQINYSFFFHDPKSVSILDETIDLTGNEPYDHVRKHQLFSQFKTIEYISYSSVYYLFPYLHIFFLVPILLVYFKRPTINFAIGRLVALWVIYPCVLILTFSNGRIFHLFGLF